VVDDRLGPELEAAVRSLRGSRGGCPAAEALVDYDALDDPARNRHPVHDHVQLCGRCQLVLLTIAGEGPRTQARSWQPWMLAAAAVLAFAIALPVLLRTPTPAAPTAGDDVVRGSALQPVEPVGAVTGVRAFNWQTPLTGVRYRVEVRRGTEVIWRAESARPPLAPDGLPSLEPGVDYTWQVHAIDAEGAIRLSSPPQPFRIIGSSADRLIG
jgi:hypothetical protein